MLEFTTMNHFFAITLVAIFSTSVFNQSYEQAIFNSEKAFEQAVAEKGMNKAFIEFLSPFGIMFMPGPVNGREAWAKLPESKASLRWDPIVIGVSSNGILGYSIGSSEYRENGKDDPSIKYGHYLSVWARQPNGKYLAALDAGYHHPKPALTPEIWKPSSIPAVSPAVSVSAGDASVGFFSAAERVGSAKAYETSLADDAYLFRWGIEPFRGKKAIVSYLAKSKQIVKFARRKSFIEAGNIAYHYSTYTLLDGSGKNIGDGHYVQIWKIVGGKWKIVADMNIPTGSDPE